MLFLKINVTLRSIFEFCASSLPQPKRKMEESSSVLDSFCTSLTRRIVEALICAQDWLNKSHGPLIMEENFLELEDLEDSKFFVHIMPICIYLYSLLFSLLLELYV